MFKWSLLCVALFLLPGIALGQTILPPYQDALGNPITEPIAVNRGIPVTAYVGISDNAKTDYALTSAPAGMTIAPSNGNVSATITWTPAKVSDPMTTESVTVTASRGGTVLDTVTWVYFVGPFDIRSMVGTSTVNVNVQEHYNRINLMVFMIGDMPYSTLYNTPVEDMLTFLKGQISRARAYNLITPIQEGELWNAAHNAKRILELDDKHPLKEKTVREHFENNWSVDPDPRIRAFYDELDKLAKNGMDVPFVHQLKLDALPASDFPTAKPSMKDFFDAFLDTREWGNLTEFQRYTSSRTDPAHAGKHLELLDEAEARGVILKSRKYITIKPLLGNRCETKDNSMVCGTVYNGSGYVPACLNCTNPQRQSFCALSNGVCTLASDPGPCSQYPILGPSLKGP